MRFAWDIRYNSKENGKVVVWFNWSHKFCVGRWKWGWRIVRENDCDFEEDIIDSVSANAFGNQSNSGEVEKLTLQELFKKKEEKKDDSNKDDEKDDDENPTQLPAAF